MKTSGCLPLPLVLLVCCWLTCVLGQVLQVKPGSCPNPPDYPLCEETMLDVDLICKEDQDCLGEEKCCYYGCKHQCMVPVKEKLLSCPYFDTSICLYARPAPAQCHNDSQCPGTQRCCCSGNCRIQCTETVKVKPGTCPAVKEECVEKEEPQCKSDTDCQEEQKCCDMCGQKCWDPEPENPGCCPAQPKTEPSCGFQATPKCHRDSDCEKNEKCCYFGCGMQCVKALEEHAGVCPFVDYTVIKCRMPPVDIYCHYDWQCKADEKCCNTGCTVMCVKSEKEKKGTCKSNEPSTDICNDKCSEDRDCPGDEKCCTGDQGRECQAP